MTRKNASGRQEWSDPDDAPGLTDALLDQAEFFDGNRFIGRGRGRPRAAAPKQAVSLRLDADILAALRQSGPGWQTRVNEILRAALNMPEGRAFHVEKA